MVFTVVHHHNDCVSNSFWAWHCSQSWIIVLFSFRFLLWCVLCAMASVNISILNAVAVSCHDQDQSCPPSKLSQNRGYIHNWPCFMYCDALFSLCHWTLCVVECSCLLSCIITMFVIIKLFELHIVHNAHNGSLGALCLCCLFHFDFFTEVCCLWWR
jgi:hypothetical protein